MLIVGPGRKAPSSGPQGYWTAAWATTTVVLGLTVLVGWMWDVALLKSVFPGVVEMKANTAVGLVLAGVSLLLLSSARTHAGRRWTGLAAAGLTLLLGALTLSQFVFGCDLGIDELLFRDSAGAVYTAIPGRMSWLTALDFVLVASALILLGTRRAIVASQQSSASDDSRELDTTSSVT